MDKFIYVVAGLSIILAVGRILFYLFKKKYGLLVPALVTIVFSLLAIYLVHWWPLIVVFSISWVLRMIGFDQSDDSDEDDDDKKIVV